MPISLNEFADRLNKIMPVIMKEFVRRQTNELYKGNITLPQFLMLFFLNSQGESRMTDLARFMKVSTAAMTGMVDRLVRCGYLLRIYEPKDRRIVKVKLSAKGAQLVKKVDHHRRDMVISIFGKISEAEREDYLRILTRIYDSLTKEQET